MKYIKTYEKLGKFKIGNYLLAKFSNEHFGNGVNDLEWSNFLNSTPGEIVDINGVLFSVKYYLPDDKVKMFGSGYVEDSGGAYVVLYISDGDIEYVSDKESVESYINTKKYNI